MPKSLPPISLPKFSWWANELEIARSLTLTKRKQRTGKKRSIVELFAVSPQIEPDGGGDNDDDDERDSMDRETLSKTESRMRKQKGKNHEKLKIKKCAKKKVCARFS